MNSNFDVEKFLTSVNFSQGYKEAVWEKISARLAANALSIDELDNVAGGLSNVSEFSDYKIKE